MVEKKRELRLSFFKLHSIVTILFIRYAVDYSVLLKAFFFTDHIVSRLKLLRFLVRNFHHFWW